MAKFNYRELFKSCNSDHDKKEIIKETVIKWYNDNKKVPKKEDFKNINNLPGAKLVAKYFGNFTNLLIYCDLPLNRLRADNDFDKLEQIKNKCIITKDNCWKWTGALTESGYGQIRYKNVLYKTHDLVGKIHYNIKDKNGKVWHHTCNNKYCCNPEHLQLVSQSYNIKESYKNRDNKNNDYHKYTKYDNNLLEWVNQNCVKNVNGCWEWPKTLNSGYAIKSIEGKSYVLSRLILSKKLNKKYEDILIAAHTCDNRKCCNPEHLYEATNRQNQLDARCYSKQTKLSTDKVIAIKKDLLTTDLTKKGSKSCFDKKWAIIYEVSESAIASIRLNKTWKDIVI